MVHNLAEFPAAVACAYASYRISGWFSAVLVQRGAPCCGASFYFSIQEYYVHDSVDGSRRRAPAGRIASLHARKSVVEGKGVSVRENSGGSRIINKKK